MKNYNYNRRGLFNHKIFLPYSCPDCNSTGRLEEKEGMILCCMTCNGRGELYEQIESNLEEQECHFCTLPFLHLHLPPTDDRWMFFPYTHKDGSIMYFCSWVCFQGYKQSVERIEQLQQLLDDKEQQQ